MFYFFLKGLQSPVYSYEDMQMLQSKLSTLVCETVVCYVWIIFWLPLICFSQPSLFVSCADGLKLPFYPLASQLCLELKL